MSFNKLLMENGVVVPTYKHIKPISLQEAVRDIDHYMISILTEAEGSSNFESMKKYAFKVIDIIRGWTNDTNNKVELYINTHLPVIDSNKKTILEFSELNPAYDKEVIITPYLIDDRPGGFSPMDAYKTFLTFIIDMIRSYEYKSIDELKSRLYGLINLSVPVDSTKVSIGTDEIFHHLYGTGFDRTEEYETVSLAELSMSKVYARYYELMQLIDSSADKMARFVTIKLTELKSQIEISGAVFPSIENIDQIKFILKVFDNVLTAQMNAADNLYGIMTLVIQSKN
jgi:hypothetical protein